MAWSYLIDRAARRAVATVTATVHGHELAAMMESVFRDPDWQAGFDVVWDGSGVTELLLEPDDIPKLVRVQAHYAAVRPGREIVFVTRSLDRAMAQIYAVRMKALGHPVHVCRTQAEVDHVLT